jgi:hypothetical protein
MTENNTESTESTESTETESAERVERTEGTTPDSLTLTELKARRGWIFAVIYLTLILGLILFLSFVEIVEKNRDVLVGILGVLTGSISSMIAVASGRDPAEIEELKSELSAQQADRAALIARLRDAQISLQLKSDQVTQLQTLMISELAQLRARQLTESDVQLNRHVAEWLPDQDADKG